MSTPAYVDSETITQADGAQSSRVPVPLPDDPYVAAEESLPLGSRVPLMSEEFEALEPSGSRTVSSHSPVSSDSTAPLSPDHPLNHVSPTPTPTRVLFHSEAAALSPSSFRKRYRSSYKTPSPSSYLTLLVRKRYRCTSELILDNDSDGDELGKEDTEEDKEDESLNADDERERGEEATPEGQQQAVLVVDTAASEPLGLGYGVARRRALESTKEITPSTYETPPYLEWSLGSLLVSLSSLVVSSPIASPVATSAATTLVDEDQFLEVGEQLELHRSILYDHTQHLDALPPNLFKGYDKDFRELYTMSGGVRYEIFSQRYKFRSLEQEQERAMMTFNVIWRPVLDLEAWTGQTDAQRAALWNDTYDIQRENHDLRRHLAKERRKRLELTNRVARMERR
nr:hypothetical protein [Tanacetum cinerariifolium]